MKREFRSTRKLPRNCHRHILHSPLFQSNWDGKGIRVRRREPGDLPTSFVHKNLRGKMMERRTRACSPRPIIHVEGWGFVFWFAPVLHICFSFSRSSSGVNRGWRLFISTPIRLRTLTQHAPHTRSAKSWSHRFGSPSLHNSSFPVGSSSYQRYVACPGIVACRRIVYQRLWGNLRS
jgi:hypothetical protein